MSMRTTLQDVADAAGVSKALVCLALNGRPGVKEATRSKIEETAKRLNYQRDPALSRIAAGRWKQRHAPPGTTLAFLAHRRPLGVYPGNRLNPERYPEYLGMTTRARDLGYLTEFHDCSRRSPEALARILFNRGIQGLVNGPLYDPAWVQAFPWSRFCSVAIFDGFVQPPVDQFTPSYAHALREGFTRARQAGFRRIGLALFQEMQEHHINFLLVSCFRHLQEELAPKDRLPVHFYNHEPAAFADWARRGRADCVIGYNDAHYWGLREGGLDIPGGIAYLSLLRDDRSLRENPAAGFAIDHELLARHAVDRVDALLRYGEFGVPSFPFVHRMMGPWRDAPSFPAAGNHS